MHFDSLKYFIISKLIFIFVLLILVTIIFPIILGQNNYLCIQGKNQLYNVIVTVHGLLMVFFILIVIIVSDMLFSVLYNLILKLLLFKFFIFKNKSKLSIYTFFLYALVDFDGLKCNKYQNQIVCSDSLIHYNLMLLGGFISIIGFIGYTTYTYYNSNNGPPNSFNYSNNVNLNISSNFDNSSILNHNILNKNIVILFKEANYLIFVKKKNLTLKTYFIYYV